jgi:hypothetical protein
MIACKADVGGVLGVNDSRIAHILGKNSNNPWLDVSKDAQRCLGCEKRKEEVAKGERG